MASGSGAVEAQVAAWLAYMHRRRELSPADAEELEDHLRSRMADLADAGLDPDEAFLVAVKRMGSLDALTRRVRPRALRPALEAARPRRERGHGARARRRGDARLDRRGRGRDQDPGSRRPVDRPRRRRLRPQRRPARAAAARRLPDRDPSGRPTCAHPGRSNVRRRRGRGECLPTEPRRTRHGAGRRAPADRVVDRGRTAVRRHRPPERPCVDGLHAASPASGWSTWPCSHSGAASSSASPSAASRPPGSTPRSS